MATNIWIQQKRDENNDLGINYIFKIKKFVLI